MDNIAVSVTVGPGPEEALAETPFFTRQLLRIPLPWLERWGTRVNIVCAVLIVLWCLASLALSLSGFFRRAGLTPGQGLLIQVAWIPFMAANMLMIIARNAHMLFWLDSQRRQMIEIEQGMAVQLGMAVQEAMQRAMAAEEAPVGPKGPTIQ